MTTDSMKSIILLEPKKKPEKVVKTQKEKQKRQVTTSNKWDFGEHELQFNYQWNLIQQIHQKNVVNTDVVNTEHCQFVLRQIHGKIYGYKAQDIDKGILQQDELIDEEYVVQAMIDCENKCYYCRENVNILYEYVREPKQWTLDRLDNKFGHNKNNVVIACLNCNLRRKTMYHERFVFTKQLNIIKQKA